MISFADHTKLAKLAKNKTRTTLASGLQTPEDVRRAVDRSERQALLMAHSVPHGKGQDDVA